MSISLFMLFGFDHIIALLLVVILIILLIFKLQTYHREKLQDRFHIWLAVLILFHAILWKVPTILHHKFLLSKDLPFHLCTISHYLIAIYLLKPDQRLFDILFYWIMGGSSLALLFPEIELGFPSTEFINLFMSHGLILFTMWYLVIVQKIKPSKRSYYTAFLALNIYGFLIVLPIDLLIGGNYLYLIEVPSVDFDPINLLPSWPWYLLVLDVFFALLFRLLYQPFHILAKQEKIEIQPKQIS